jgi:hypothetical protein
MENNEIIEAVKQLPLKDQVDFLLLENERRRQEIQRLIGITETQTETIGLLIARRP